MLWQQKKTIAIFSLVLFLSVAACFFSAHAGARFIIDPGQSTLTCSVRYVLIGCYEVKFTDFSGEIELSGNDVADSAMTVTVKTASLESEHLRLDKIACSPRLLDTRKFPESVFTSYSVVKDHHGYSVTGEVNLHGVSRTISFPLQTTGLNRDAEGKFCLKVHGQWKVNRKDFNVVWHPLLDKGGIIVSNIVAMDWIIVACRVEDDT